MAKNERGLWIAPPPPQWGAGWRLSSAIREPPVLPISINLFLYNSIFYITSRLASSLQFATDLFTGADILRCARTDAHCQRRVRLQDGSYRDSRKSSHVSVCSQWRSCSPTTPSISANNLSCSGGVPRDTHTGAREQTPSIAPPFDLWASQSNPDRYRWRHPIYARPSQLCLVFVCLHWMCGGPCWPRRARDAEAVWRQLRIRAARRLAWSHTARRGWCQEFHCLHSRGRRQRARLPGARAESVVQGVC